MGQQIMVVRDPELAQSEIIHTLESTVTDDGTGMEGTTDVDQTDVYGVIVPILSLNNVAVGIHELVRFELDMTGRVPEAYFKFRDRNKQFEGFTNPGNDNELRVQILPPSENTYKKIDYTMFVDEISINQGVIEGRARFKLAKFTSDQYEALGQKTTYELFDHVSIQTGLGFASNVSATEDKRFMECRYKSYKDVVDDEIEKSVSDLTQVYDWWIDQNNYLVLCNMHDRVDSIDEDKDMMVWITGNSEDVSRGAEHPVTQTVCVLTNHPGFSTSDLSVYEKEIRNNPVQQGNTKIVSLFFENRKDWGDNYIGDGDIKRDEFMEFEYGGEVYGDYDYLFAGQARDLYLSKIKSETIVAKMKKPMLGLNRGSQVKFVWYDNDASMGYTQSRLNDMAKQGSPVMTPEQIFINYPELSWLSDYIMSKEMADTYPMILDMQYSGQYTVIGQYIIYENGSWLCELHLTRPQKRKPEILPITDPETGEPVKNN